ncbi:MAG TPA: DUF2231 domain-containing protein [Gemmatimonadales bacterium]|nr:DUF2231 domain-containing protein [Gemmatimonadales bacterium]
MPNIASWHPQIVHFVIALLFVGVALRLVSLTGKLAFTGPAAATLILIGTVAAVLAVTSGDDAHGPVERIPGVRAAEQVHEDAARWAEKVFLGVAALELIGLALAKSPYRRYVLWASGVVGVVGCAALYKTGERGGNLVYNYAGGIGTRSGAPEDVGHLLVAGLYQQALLDRQQGKAAEAADLIMEMARRAPDDTTARLLAIESLIVDRHDGKGALAVLATIHSTPADSRFFRFRVGLLRSDAYAAIGKPDSAKLVLQALQQEFGPNRNIDQRMGKLK